MATQNPDLYRKRLSKEMCKAFRVRDLKLISANLGFGLDFIGDQDHEYECQRLIEQCMVNGFPMMKRLLAECQEMRKDRAFPKLPEDEELW